MARLMNKAVLHGLEALRQQLEAALRQGQRILGEVTIDGEPLPSFYHVCTVMRN